MTRFVRFAVLPSARQAGLSLVEVMVALALSLILVLGLIEIFGSTRAAFASSAGLARTQENSRFALDFLRRETRMAGHFGCLNEFGHLLQTAGFYHHLIPANAALTTATSPLRIDLPIEVYDFAGTTPGTSYTVAAPVVATDGTGWNPDLPVGATQLNVIKAGAGGIIPGSDVLVVRYFDEAPLTLSTGPTATTTWNLAGGEGGIDYVNGRIFFGPGSPSVVVNAVYAMTNCAKASLFQVTGTQPTWIVSQAGANQPNPTGGPRFWHPDEVYAAGSILYRYRAVAYYVGLGTNGGPSLFRLAMPEAPIGGTAAGVRFAIDPEEVVEDVELMQILLGTSAVPTAAGRIDDVTRYESVTTLLTGVTNEADRATALRRIGSVRVSLLLRSPEAGAGVNPTSPTTVVGDVIVTPPVDQRIRQVYDSMILLRNRQRA